MAPNYFFTMEFYTGIIGKLPFHRNYRKMTMKWSFSYNSGVKLSLYNTVHLGAQWLSGRVLDSRPRGRGFEPHRRHWVVVLEQDTFILA